MSSDDLNRHSPVCPLCKTPLHRRFHLNEPLKMVLAILLIGYIVFSVMIFLAGTPPEMRKGCGSFDYRIQLPFTTPNPERCRETASYLWLESLLDIPGIQIFIYGGLAAGILIFYYDWFEELYRKWKAKRADAVQNNSPRFKYRCRKCGQQWN